MYILHCESEQEAMIALDNCACLSWYCVEQQINFGIWPWKERHTHVHVCTM